MKLSEIFGENVIFELKADEKEDAIREMVGRLCADGLLARSSAAGVRRAIMRREELGTTGIGGGVALPHAKHPAVKGVVGVVGRSSRGIQFDSLDGQPVHLIFLIISSPDAVEPHIEALRKVTALVRDGDLCSFMKRAKSREELVEIIEEADERL